MQEKKQAVFVIGTANDVTALPPEFLRSGRFDATFFLDLPTTVERRAIFEVHLSKRKRPLAMFDLDELASASAGFVGAEIEQAVVDAMHLAYNDKASPRREFTTEDLIVALVRLVPLSRSQRERIETLRTWLRDGRAQSASYTESRKHEEQFVKLQLD
jgi:SpoVK/Ycf46/Vps4 family AAA+-type ATPase